MDSAVQADIPDPQVESLQQQLADVWQRVQHLVLVSSTRVALQGLQLGEAQSAPLR